MIADHQSQFARILIVEFVARAAVHQSPRRNLLQLFQSPKLMVVKILKPVRQWSLRSRLRPTAAEVVATAMVEATLVFAVLIIIILRYQN